MNTRLLFVSDLHGSDIVWKKALTTSRAVRADAIILAGDLTGKAIVPIVKTGPSEWYYAPWERKLVLRSREELEGVIKEIEGKGFYSIEVNPSELEELQTNNDKLQAVFLDLILKKLDRWLRMIDTYVPSHVKVIVSPGNDDALEIDDVIKQNDRVIYPLNGVVDIDGKNKMISCAWSNPTPWHTSRECSEQELREKLEMEFSRVDSFDGLICNFHAPPYGTSLDIAPKLDENLKPVTKWGSIVQIHVGSKAIRELIEKYQPILGLHGHIHECSGVDRLGKTTCINPGSDYQRGILSAYVINIINGRVECWHLNG
jgi:Icc-related predicted phosphoesterase